MSSVDQVASGVKAMQVQEAKGGKKGGKKAAAAAAAASDEKVTFDVDKNADFPAWYEHILVEADVMDKRYPVKGMPVFTSYGFFMHNVIMNMMEEQWTQQGIDKVQFPILIPLEFLEREADHIAGFSSEVFWVTKGGDKDLEKPCALRPTSETAMYSMFSLWVQSFRDLPVKIHQTCTVYRYETKNTMPLIRAREIYWNEAHTAHASADEALSALEDAWRGYLHVINDVCGVYGMRLRRPVWDKFAGAEHTDVMDAILPSGKVLQIVGAHYLGQKFAVPFDIKFLNRDNVHEHAYMTCFGVSTRVLASTLGIHGDNKGLVLPPPLAKFEVVMTPIVMKNKVEIVLNAAEELYSTLKAAGIRVYLDDSDKKPGEKYYHWEMRGVPVRLELGPRDVQNGTVCLVRRDTGEKTTVPAADAVSAVRATLAELHENLKSRSQAHFREHVTTCATLDDIKAALDKGGFARFPYFSDGLEGKRGEDIIKDHCGGEIRGFVPGETVEEGLLCIITGEPATCYAYVARSY